MSTTGSILSIARSALTAHQVAIQTVSHNIANVETEGYSRQRAEFSTRWPQRLAPGNVGTGLDVHDIVRLRDQLLDASYRRDAGARDAYALRHELLSGIESILGEPSDTGLAHSLDQFWNAWSDLSNNPGSAAAQGVVRQRGVQVAHTLNGYATRIGEVGDRVRMQATTLVGEVNVLTSQFAELNRQITTAEVEGVQAPDLRDRRDRIADRLAQVVGGRVEGQRNGTVAVYIGSMMLVDASNARTLEVRGTTTVAFGLRGDPEPLKSVGGQLGELARVLTTEIPAIVARLDDVARAVVNGVNEYHASGWTAAGDALGGANWNPVNGPTGSRVDFFDAVGTTAATMRLSSAVSASASVIAAGDVPGAPGNNSIALAIGALRDGAGMAALQARMGAAFASQIGLASGVSFGEHYAQTISSLGADVADAASSFSIHETLARQADNRRAAVSGVSLDEELTLLMRHQQAYVAATRLVSVADEMVQSILGMV